MKLRTHFTLLLWASSSILPQDLGTLKNIPIPRPSSLDKYVKDQAALVLLGKALFWDIQAGSDGRMACATCHFHAGADHRAQNQLAKGNVSELNHYLRGADFPTHLLANFDDNRSEALRDSPDVVGSAGLHGRIFGDIVIGAAPDNGFDRSDTLEFNVNGINLRRVTERNTPTVLNAVFYVRNFWNGRASEIFTGFTPFGDSDSRMNSLMTDSGNRLIPDRVRLDNASLASQAVGPPLNDVEMSYKGRTWPKLGKKILSLRPLVLQWVAPDDSVLGALSNSAGRGLRASLTYLSLIQNAFKQEFWNSNQLVDAGGESLGKAGAPSSTDEFTQAEFNFALFWGLAIQAYETTLISDDSPFDRFSEGVADALSADQQLGLQIFRGRGGCTNNCHVGPEFTSASFTSINRRGSIQGGRNGANGDTGYFRTGVRPISEDLGLAADDDFGRPLSLAVAQRADARTSVRAAFKTPTQRNIEFTGPYFHNGGQLNLEQVVDFYARGSDFPDGGNLGPGIRRRNLSRSDRDALVSFMKALSDDRVRFERAPFDHPELCIPAGHPQNTAGILQADTSDPRFTFSATDRWALIPAVGREGNSAPLQTFEELLLGIGSDGSRAHTLTETCSVP